MILRFPRELSFLCQKYFLNKVLWVTGGCLCSTIGNMQVIIAEVSASRAFIVHPAKKHFWQRGMLQHQTLGFGF